MGFLHILFLIPDYRQAVKGTTSAAVTSDADLAIYGKARVFGCQSGHDARAWNKDAFQKTDGPRHPMGRGVFALRESQNSCAAARFSRGLAANGGRRLRDAR